MQILLMILKDRIYDMNIKLLSILAIAKRQPCQDIPDSELIERLITVDPES